MALTFGSRCKLPRPFRQRVQDQAEKQGSLGRDTALWYL
jgi:hypothetical protein